MFTNSQTWSHVCLSQSQGWVLKATVQWALWLVRFSVYFQCGVGPRVFTMGARMGQKGVFIVGAPPATPNTTRPGDSNDSITLGGLSSSHVLWPLAGPQAPAVLFVRSLIHSLIHPFILF